jgi:hypothetical protein
VSSRSNAAGAAGIFEPFPIAEVPWEEFSHGERFGMRFQHLSTFGGATRIGVANEVLAPGRQANPLHYHLLEEEHVFILEGSYPHPHDVAVFPETGRVSVKLTGEGYRRSATMDYWENIDAAKPL